MKHLCLNCEKGDMVSGKKNCDIAYRGHRATVQGAGDGIVLSAEKSSLLTKGARYAEAFEKLRLKVDIKEAAELMRIRKK